MIFGENNVLQPKYIDIYEFQGVRAELCALVNKPSGASDGASDLKY